MFAREPCSSYSRANNHTAYDLRKADRNNKRHRQELLHIRVACGLVVLCRISSRLCLTVPTPQGIALARYKYSIQGSEKPPAADQRTGPTLCVLLHSAPCWRLRAARLLRRYVYPTSSNWPYQCFPLAFRHENGPQGGGTKPGNTTNASPGQLVDCLCVRRKHATKDKA